MDTTPSLAATKPRIATPARVGARGIDAVSLVDTADKAEALKAAGVEFVVQYLGSVTHPIVQTILDADLAFSPVTYANRFDGPTTVRELSLLGLPPGVTVWLDVESVEALNPIALQAKINAWAGAVIAAGYMPGLYVGPGSVLTSFELYRLRVVRYWRCGARILDRSGQLAEPGCGFCMDQLFPSITTGGLWTDLDVVQEDFRGRLPVFTTQENAA